MARRLIETIRHTKDDLVAKVYRDVEWDEYRVVHYVGGTKQEGADYHTDDKADAQSHARSFAWFRPQTSQAQGATA